MNITPNYQLKSVNSRINNQQLKSNLSFGNKQQIEKSAKVIVPMMAAAAGTVLAIQNGKLKPENDWKEIRSLFRSMAEDLYYEKEETDAKIDKLIEKLDKEAVNKELGEYAKQGLEYIKEHSEHIVYVDTACIGGFIGDARYLHRSILLATQTALYPDLVDEKQKNLLPELIKTGKAYMCENN